MENSKIEWTHHTFNPWEGCAKVSAGCKNCYADARHDRYHGEALGALACWGVNAPRMARSLKHWNEPLKWNREAQAAGERSRVFCASLADVFEQQTEVSRGYAGMSMDVPTKDGKGTRTYLFADIEAERQKLWKLIEVTPWLDWLLLTKRPENVMAMLPWRWLMAKEVFDNYPKHLPDDGRMAVFEEMFDKEAGFQINHIPPNVWVGTSVEDQDTANTRIPELLKVPAPVRFLSIEPLLGRVNLLRINIGTNDEQDVLHGWKPNIGDNGANTAYINWVIVGGESGANARPMYPEYVRMIRDACERADTPFFFKQWGEYVYNETVSWANMPKPDGVLWPSGKIIVPPKGLVNPTVSPAAIPFKKVGKAAAGRVLDGKVYDQLPTNSRA